MLHLLKHRTRVAIALVSVVCVFVSGGCGGGGGNAGSKGYGFGSSFRFSGAGQSFSISVDGSGRFTAYAFDPVSLVVGVGLQGAVSPTGQFFAQNDDGSVSTTGTIDANSTFATFTVKKNGTIVIGNTATLQAPGAATAGGITGTYYGSPTAANALLTLDATSHGVLFVNKDGIVGGGAVGVDTSGNLTSTDGNTAGQITVASGVYTLNVTKIAGAAVSKAFVVVKSTRAKWTFLVFLNGANDLQPFGPLNFNQMEKTGSTADVNIVVQWKQASCGTCGSPSWTGTRRYLVQKDSDTTTVNSPIVEDMGSSVDMGDWHELKNFVSWGQRSYPADHYALVIWNHGAGWRDTRAAGNKLGNPLRSVSLDDSTNHEIQVWDLPQALSVTPKMDLIVFDASLMLMTEVAYELKDSAPYLAGSEESPPGEGYVYNTFLNDLVLNPSMGPVDLGTAIVNRTLESYGTSNNLTQCLIDLSKMQGVATALDAFGNQLQANAAANQTVIRTARSSAQHYAYFDNKDLWHYSELIRAATPTSSVASSALNLQTAIQNAVMVEKHGIINANSHGLAIYVPAPLDYRSTYSNLSLARNTGWEAWLQAQP